MRKMASVIFILSTFLLTSCGPGQLFGPTLHVHPDSNIDSYNHPDPNAHTDFYCHVHDHANVNTVFHTNIYPDPYFDTYAGSVQGILHKRVRHIYRLLETGSLAKRH